jgi:hypothetical protein
MCLPMQAEYIISSSLKHLNAVECQFSGVDTCAHIFVPNIVFLKLNGIFNCIPCLKSCICFKLHMPNLARIVLIIVNKIELGDVMRTTFSLALMTKRTSFFLKVCHIFSF